MLDRYKPMMHARFACKMQTLLAGASNVSLLTLAGLTLVQQVQLFLAEAVSSRCGVYQQLSEGGG